MKKTSLYPQGKAINKSTFPNLPVLPDMCPTLAPKQMGNLNFANDPISSRFSKPEISPFIVDNFGKEKSTFSVEPIAMLDLNQLHHSLAEHLCYAFPDKKFSVKPPFYNGTLKVGWPAKVSKVDKMRELQPIDLIENGESKDISMEEFNQRVSFNNIKPKMVEVVTKLWIRGDMDPDGALIYVVGFYFQIDAVHF